MRIRTIKPEFFTHEGLYQLEVETKLPCRLAFAGLWCAADREGRFKWEARRLGIQILPYDEKDFSRVLVALASRGFIVKYRVDSRDFGWIPTFLRHQVVNNRERESELPDPSKASNEATPDATGTRAPRVEDAGQAEGKGRELEGKGSEGGVTPALPKELDCPSFVSKWTAYVDYRKKRKLPALLPESIEAQWRKFVEYGADISIIAINDTIANAWQGIFPEKVKPPASPTIDKSRTMGIPKGSTPVWYPPGENGEPARKEYI